MIYNNMEMYENDYGNEDPSVIAALSTRILFFQTMFKSLDLISYHQKRLDKIKKAFLMLKNNACGGKISKMV